MAVQVSISSPSNTASCSSQMAKNVAPNGLPTARSLTDASNVVVSLGFPDAIVVLRRKSWVTAMPMLAKDSDVRNQARKVRSVSSC